MHYNYGSGAREPVFQVSWRNLMLAGPQGSATAAAELMGSHLGGFCLTAPTRVSWTQSEETQMWGRTHPPEHTRLRSTALDANARQCVSQKLCPPPLSRGGNPSGPQQVTSLVRRWVADPQLGLSGTATEDNQLCCLLTPNTGGRAHPDTCQSMNHKGNNHFPEEAQFL